MTILFLYYGAMAAGYYLASRLRDISEKFDFIDMVFNALIVLLVLVMGLRMGSDPKVVENLGKIGIYSFIVTVIVMTCTVIFVSISRNLLGLDKKANNRKNRLITVENVKVDEILRPNEDSVVIEGGAYHEGDSVAKTNIITMFLVVLPLTVGLLVGYRIIYPGDIDVEYFSSLTGDIMVLGVTLLLFAIGFSMGLRGNILNSVKKIGIKFLIFPFSAILGSLLGGVISAVVLPLSIPEGLAISAGFGWYTMAPTVITEAGHAYAGAISFMHNIIREMGGIVLIPFVVNKIGYIESTSLAGVCAMDIGMPIIERCTKEEMVAYSFGMGVSMSIVVPFLVPLFINM